MDANCQLITQSIMDPLSLVLEGRTLIEASAGTGKTYTLSFLYLRLLLGIGVASAARSLSVKEILVVTFTRAATDELRYKIREALHRFRIACVRGYHEDPLYQRLLMQISNPALAAQVLNDAEQHMDEAAIYTIHGFCQRILMQYALESNVLLEFNVSHQMPLLYLNCAEEIWRRFFNPLPKSVAKMLQSYWPNPGCLLAGIKKRLPWRHNERLVNELSSAFILEHYQLRASLIQELKIEWRRSRAELEICLAMSDVNKQSYSKKNRRHWLAIIDEFVATSTDTLFLPQQLTKFAESTLISKSGTTPPRHRIFQLIDKILAMTPFDEILLPVITQYFVDLLTMEKIRLAEMESDDLLGLLHQALLAREGGEFSKQLAIAYPAALVDEFQDTDAVQYAIFDSIYSTSIPTQLLLIGDPKQSIYRFRGADIFVYMQAKKEVDRIATMGINWRSGAVLVKGINALFTRTELPFKFAQIPFYQIEAAAINQQKHITCNGKTLPAFQYYALESVDQSKDEFLWQSARSMARYLDYLLQESKTILWQADKSDPLLAKDIAILVRDRHEAQCVQKALQERKIASVYLSNRDNVFTSQEAKELLWVLKAVLEPRQFSLLPAALSTHFFNLDLATLADLNDNTEKLEAYTEEFMEYRQYWFRYGIMPMIRRIMMRHNLAALCLSDKQGGERRLTNIMHLAELLQVSAETQDHPQGLLLWFSKQMFDGAENQEVATLRLESDQNVVKIITIHKSKGLEYPVVFLPFLTIYKKAKEGEYHDRTTFERLFAHKADKAALALLEEERLAEDVRLVYVALTRAIYLCCLGLGEFNQKDLPWYDSGLGSLLNTNSQGETPSFWQAVEEVPYLTRIELPDTNSRGQVLSKQHTMPVAKQFQRHLYQDWAVNSYSSWHQVKRKTHSLEDLLLPTFDIEAMQELTVHEDRIAPSERLAIIDLPKGAKVGTLLHQLFESVDFSRPIDESIFTHILHSLHLEESFRPVLSSWFSGILATKLSDESGALNQIKPQQKQAEMNFCLPIERSFSGKDYHNLSKNHDPITATCAPLCFSPTSGVLKGYIDLIFESQNKFYIVDYKSNYLGQEENDYELPQLIEAMKRHRYDIQYQLYSLALHRYLKQRLANYHYENHFGGVYYLFLRGIHIEKPKQGIFYCRPPHALIHGLDRLFSGTDQPA